VSSGTIVWDHRLRAPVPIRCLFPGASTFKTFSPVTNPHEFSADGVTFLGTSGQNVDDVWKCGHLGTPLSRSRTWLASNLSTCCTVLRHDHEDGIFAGATLSPHCHPALKGPRPLLSMDPATGTRTSRSGWTSWRRC
jgi:hypothetical protein